MAERREWQIHELEQKSSLSKALNLWKNQKMKMKRDYLKGKIDHVESSFASKK